jgi:hypothetical protein
MKCCLNFLRRLVPDGYFEPGGNRRIGNIDSLPHQPLDFRLVCNSESKQLDLKVSQRGQMPASVFLTIGPLVPCAAVPRISHLAPELKSMPRRRHNETKY